MVLVIQGNTDLAKLICLVFFVHMRDQGQLTEQERDEHE